MAGKGNRPKSTGLADRTVKSGAAVDFLVGKMGELTGARRGARDALREQRTELTGLTQAAKGSSKALNETKKESVWKGVGKGLLSSLDETRSALGLLGETRLSTVAEDLETLQTDALKLDRAGRTLGGTFETFFESLEQRTGQSALKLAKLTSILDRSTFDPHFAAEGATQASIAAKNYGGDPEEYLPAAGALADAGVDQDEIGSHFDRMAVLAKAAGVKGGPRAVLQGFGALREQVKGSMAPTDANMRILEALYTAQAKELGPTRAAQSVGESLSQLKSGAQRYTATTGINLTNSENQLDLSKVPELESNILKRYKGSPKLREQVLKAYGAAGPAMLHGRFGKAAQAAKDIEEIGYRGEMSHESTETDRRLGLQNRMQLQHLEMKQMQRQALRPAQLAAMNLREKLGARGQLAAEAGANVLQGYATGGIAGAVQAGVTNAPAIVAAARGDDLRPAAATAPTVAAAPSASQFFQPQSVNLSPASMQGIADAIHSKPLKTESTRDSHARPKAQSYERGS